MKIIETPITISTELGIKGWSAASPDSIVEHLVENFKNTSALFHTYTDSTCMVTMMRNEATKSKELLSLELENKLSTFSNSKERKYFFPMEKSFRSYMLAVDKKSFSNEVLVPAGTVVYCIGKMYYSAYESTDIKDYFILTDGENTVFCTEDEMKNTWKPRKIDLKDVFSEDTTQYVYLNQHKPSLISKIPVYAGSKMFCIGKIYISGEQYYILCNFKNSVLCRRKDFCVMEEVEKLIEA